MKRRAAHPHSCHFVPGLEQLEERTVLNVAPVIVVNPAHAYRAPQVLIGDQVSIGYGATILGPSAIGGYDGAAKPTQIGAGAVIGEGAVVTHDVGPGEVVAGVPARLLRRLN